MAHDWLPELECLVDYGNDWQKYLERLYTLFRRDFVTSHPSLVGKPCEIKRDPIIRFMEAGFWHLITDGEVEEERLPALRRCERISWPRPLIEASSDGGKVRTWRNKRGRGSSQSRLLIALDDFSYLVVLADTGRSFLLITAYPIEHSSQSAKLAKEYEAQKE